MLKFARKRWLEILLPFDNSTKESIIELMKLDIDEKKGFKQACKIANDVFGKIQVHKYICPH